MSAVPFSTDYSTLVVFDPEVLDHRIRDPEGWWRGRPADVEEVATGRLALLPIGKEGSYRVELCAGPLSDEHQALAVGSMAAQGIEVTSGQVFYGSAERLPGDGAGARMADIPGTGAFAEVETGKYGVEVWVLNWRHEDAHYDEDGEVRSGAPADFVIQLTLRDADPTEIEPTTTLLALIPKPEAKGKAKVVVQPHRRRSNPDPTSGRKRRRRSAALDPLSRGPVDAAPPPHVPEEIAPYSAELVRASFREVLYGDQLHPPTGSELEMILFKPRESGIMAHDIGWTDLFGKLTRVREQMRVLEAKVNTNDKLSWCERAELETPITGVYEAIDGLLTSLSVELSPRG